MCLILVAQGVRPGIPLVLVANRDEFHARPTAPAGFWETDPDMIAGRDLMAGGTWLGVSRGGRIAAVTNIREPHAHRDDARSRGEIPLALLRNGEPVETIMERLVADGDAYNGFNVVAGTADTLWYGSNRDPASPRRLEPGLIGVSNSVLDDPWPKVRSGLRDLERALTADELSYEALFDVLANDRTAPDADLPDTGVGLERERALSSRFIRMPGYGTRSSTVVTVGQDGHVVFVERTWPTGGGLPETRAFRFRYDSTSEAIIHAG